MSKVKKYLYIVVEGETDLLFYKKILEVFREKSEDKRTNFEQIKCFSLDGIGRFESKLIGKFESISQEIYKDNKSNEIYLFLCYDTDVFVGTTKPPVDWKKVDSKLKKMKIKVHHIEADPCIENLILIDFDGICKFLKISNQNPSKYKGLAGLKKLYKSANKPYIKGSSAGSLIDALDFNKIEERMCSQLSAMCRLLNINCKKTK